MKRGQETIMPNWVYQAVYHLTNASDIKVLMFLAEHWRYQQSTFGPGHIADKTGLDYRTVCTSLRRLAEAGHIVSASGVHCLHGACATVVHRLYKSTPKSEGKKSHPEQENPKSHLEIDRLKEEKEEKERRERKREEVRLDGIEPNASSDPQPAAPKNENGEVRNLESAPSPLSLEKPETVNLEGEAEASLAPPIPPEFRATPPSRPAVARSEHHGDDHGAVDYFLRLAGPRFAMDYRLHLSRWMATYTLEFIGLAFKLAPTMPGAKGIFTFVDLLNQDSRKPWPEALQAQYQRDLKTILQANTPAPLNIRVRPGDVLRWPDGRTATVERVDSADAVTDALDDERGYVPLSHIGRSVQVIHA